MNFGDWLHRHRRSLLFMVAMLALAGGWAAFGLPVTLFPTVEFPRAVVALEAGDRPAEQMALLVTAPVEQAVRRVPGVRSVRSTTSRGAADISVNFDWGTDMSRAALQIDAAIAPVLASLPAGTTASTRRMDPTTFPIIAYSLTASRTSLAALRDVATLRLRPLLSSIDGVAQVQVSGGATQEYQVIVDPERLLARGLTVGDVAQALGAANVVSAAGRIEDHYRLLLAVADARMRTLDDLRNSVLRIGPTVVRLADVARVEDAHVPEWVRVDADGRDAVLIEIFQQPGSNSARIAAEVRTRLEGARTQLPPDVQLASWYDQSVLVVESAASVRDAILLGVTLAALVLFLFLRSLRITLIAIVVLPAVLAATVVLLDVLGMSFNIMTLGGMAAAVGLVIDDAIVMIEHIVRRTPELEGPHHQRVMAAAHEFAGPLAGSSAATLVIFVPLAFLTGVTGAFFKALSLTMASALLISFFITLVAVPLLSERFLAGHQPADRREGLLARTQHRYTGVLRRLLARPLLALLLVVPLLLAGLLAWRQVGSGFMPEMDEGGFVLDYLSAPGTALSETDRLLRQVEKIITDNPHVSAYSRRTGLQLGGGITEANTGDFFIRLKDGARPPIDEVMDAIRQRIESEVPGLEIELLQLMEDVIGDLTAVPQPIEVKLFSDDPAVLLPLARKVAERLGTLDGVVDVKDGVNPAGDALNIRIDPVKAGLEGTDAATVAKGLEDLLSGAIGTRIEAEAKSIGVRVWIPAALRSTPRAVGELRLRAPDGHLFPLARVAQIDTLSGQPQIARENLRRMAAVTARISGTDLGSAIKAVRKVLAEPGLIPPAVYFELGGLYEQQQIAFKGLLRVFVCAVALVFLLLLFLYERLVIALAIIAMPLLAVCASFVALWLTRIDLNISALMGMTMIVGIVTEVAIFYFSEADELAAEGHSGSDLLVQAGANRLRPILMTTLAAILALLPLALALGPGSAMQQPLAVSIVAGLIVQLPLVLLVMPVLYAALESAATRGRRAAEKN